MATVIPVDEFITDEWYPGFKPGYTHAPWYIDPVQTFRKEDEENFWFLDFHWPRGLTPMGLIWNEDGYNWSSQLAAEQMPLPPGRGITCRLGGTHTYGSPLPVTDVREIGQRARRLERVLPPFLQNFDEIWGHMREEVNESWDYFSGVDLSALSLRRPAGEPHPGPPVPQARLRDPLRGDVPAAGELRRLLQHVHRARPGPGPDRQVPAGLRHQDHGDRPGAVAADQRGPRGRPGVRCSLPSDADGIRAAPAAHGGPAGTWLTQFYDFLQVYGWRTEGSCDIALPSWIEDPTPALGTIKTFLLKDTDHDFEAARNAAVEEREAAVDAARSTLTLEEQKLFDGGLHSRRAATSRGGRTTTTTTSTCAFRCPCGGPARASRTGSGSDHQDDTLYLFWEEIMDVSAGRRPYDAGLRSLVEQRKQDFDDRLQRLLTLPKVVGTIPELVNDPILIEIFGLNSHFLRAVEAAAVLGGQVKTLIRRARL